MSPASKSAPKSSLVGRRLAPLPPGTYTIANVLAITCPVCQVRPGDVCDGSAGGTYDATSRGLIHDARARAAGLTVSLTETVSPYVVPGTETPAMASITLVAASTITNNNTLTVPDGVGGVVVFEFEVDGGFSPTPGRVTVDLTSVFPSGTAEDVRTLLDAAIVQNTMLSTASNYAGVEQLFWPIPGTVGNGQLVTVGGPYTATNFSAGVGTSTLAFAKGTILANAGIAGFVNNDKLVLDTDAGPGTLMLELEVVALGFVPTAGYVTVDLTAAVTAADVLAAIDEAIFENSDFVSYFGSFGTVDTIAWPVPGAAGNGQTITQTLATPGSLTVANFAGGSN
jgi:hypothetical protein